jgi:hypothetical protein
MALKTEYQYIRFVLELPISDKRKTSSWSIQNIRHQAHLGGVRWDGAWRQYTFYPFGLTVFSAGCLRDIAEFLTNLRKSEQEAR